MLPTAADNGARLAAILPTGLIALARGLGTSNAELLDRIGALGATTPPRQDLEALSSSVPGLRSLVLIVVDGLGSANLRASRASAPTLARLSSRRIETVLPSTTGAAITTLATGTLPGRHGLIGYRIRHPELGLRTTLSEWEGIGDVREWQRSEPLWALAEDLGARAFAIGRPSHQGGGLTRAILSGAEYVPAQTIEDRFAAASQLLRSSSTSPRDPALIYLYVDELDRAGHTFGWQSAQWDQRLRAFDTALDSFLRGLPAGVGVAVTADHGMIDVPEERRILLDAEDASLPGIADAVAIGGEPRFRSIYLPEGADADGLASTLGSALGRMAWVGTRAEAVRNGWFGDVAPEVLPRLGEILVVARSQVAFVLSTDADISRAMVGQHGALSAEERGIPLLLGGELNGTGFARAVESLSRLFKGY